MKPIFLDPIGVIAEQIASFKKTVLEEVTVIENIIEEIFEETTTTTQEPVEETTTTTIAPRKSRYSKAKDEDVTEDTTTTQVPE